MRPRRCLALAALFVIGTLALLVPGAAATPAAGPCGVTEFRSGEPLVMTYLYYWYDARSLDDPALTLHPPSGQPFDWSDPAWHRRQLLDMADAGVDVALAVYWGASLEWSIYGLDALVAAREALLAEGARPPAIGLFYDSNLYADLLTGYRGLSDLREEIGREVFVGHMLHFFERVPTCHAAKIDGRPLVFLWRPDTEVGDRLRFDQATIDSVYARIERRLGVRPYLVRERTWSAYAESAGETLQTDDIFGWGAALRGPLFDGRTVAVGPGYDDRLVPDRQGYVRDREQGRAYQRDLRAATMSGAPWLLLETWNELWEATAIAETARYGREYLELTRQYVSIFRQLHGWTVRHGWVDPGTGEDYVTWLADAPEERGTPAVIDGRVGARPFVEPGDSVGYAHFAVRPRLRVPESGPVTILVEYFDGGQGSFAIEYDADDVDEPGDGIYRATPAVTLTGSNIWRDHAFELPDARFRKRQYGGYGDFRIRDQPVEGEPTHVFGRVIVSTEPGSRPILLGPENLSPLQPVVGHYFELRWRGVPGAVGYLVQLVRPGTDVPMTAPLSVADHRRCGGGPAWTELGTTQAVTTGERCLLEHVPSVDPGLYRWRVIGLGASGQPIADPSDWGLLLATR